MDLATVTAAINKAIASAQAAGASASVTAWQKVLADLGSAPPTLQWVKLGAGGPVASQGWWKPIALADGRIWMSFGAIPSTWIFDCNAGTFTRTNNDTTHFYKNLGPAENYDLAFDYDHNRVYKSLGSPNSWRAPGGSENTGPQYGELRYEVALDEFFTDWPASTVTYRPVAPDDIAHWDINGLGKTMTAADGCLDYWSGSLYCFGSFSVGSYSALKKRVLATGVVTTLENYQDKSVLGADGWPKYPPWTLPSRTPYLRSGVDHRTGTAWTDADNCERWDRDLSLPAYSGWKHIVTTGDKPATSPPGDGSTGTDWGILTERHEAANCQVAWCGLNGQVSTSGLTAFQKTWVCPLDTNVWKLQTIAGPLPPAHVAVVQALVYNAFRKTINLVVQGANSVTEVWELRGLL